MTTAAALLAEQDRRLRELDPGLPPPVAPPRGESLRATCGDVEVAGVLVRTAHPAGSPALTWSAAHVCELVPLLGSAGAVGMEALLSDLRSRLPELALPAEDSSCVVTWPSRDVSSARALLDHGFVPLSVIATRSVRRTDPGPGVPDAGLVLRRAGPADLDQCVALALAEYEYSALVGGTVRREHAPASRRRSLQTRLAGPDPIWVAEHDGILVGLAECGYVDAAPGSWLAARLPAGRWGYVNCLSVLPGARGRGIGQRLMAHVHTEFARAGLAGSYLYFHPANPLSSVFWPRQGYRPLWTVWEVRPAPALR